MLAPRTAIEGGVIVTHPCSHVGIRRKYRRSRRPRILEYPISALDQFGARIVASEEKGRGELHAIQEIHLQLKFIQSDRPIIFVAHSLGGLIVKDVRL